MSRITTHILDTSIGQPAKGVRVVLERQGENGEWVSLAGGMTDSDGRLRDLMGPGTTLERGVHRLTFQSGEYFTARRVEAFYPYVEVVFAVADPGRHYHVPLLLSPFGYSTYRGS